MIALFYPRFVDGSKTKNVLLFLDAPTIKAMSANLRPMQRLNILDFPRSEPAKNIGARRARSAKVLVWDLGHQAASSGPQPPTAGMGGWQRGPGGDVTSPSGIV